MGSVAGPVLILAVISIAAIAILGAMSNQVDGGTVKDSKEIVAKHSDIWLLFYKSSLQRLFFKNMALYQ